MRRRTLLRAGLAVALAGLLAAGGSAGWAWSELRRPYAAWPGAFVDVLLEPGLDAGSLLQRLGAAGVLRRPGVVRAWLSLRGGSEGLQAGEYRFARPATPLEVLERLRAGDVLLHPVTIPEGLVLEEIALRVADAGFGDADGLLARLRDPAPLRSIDPQAQDLEGYLFPDTYHFPRGATPRTIVAAMLDRFVAASGPDYAARAAAVGLDLRGAVTLASLIERETSVPGERRRISGVFHNRLRRGMLLQCDPTVLYALRRSGRPVQRLYSRHLEFDSPWNTYRYPGLPPGPIASPGLESLRAAVDPAPGDELYFVAAPNGGHRFSKSLREHQQAVAEWRAYSRSSR